VHHDDDDDDDPSTWFSLLVLDAVSPILREPASSELRQTPILGARIDSIQNSIELCASFLFIHTI